MRPCLLAVLMLRAWWEQSAAARAAQDEIIEPAQDYEAAVGTVPKTCFFLLLRGTG